MRIHPRLRLDIGWRDLAAALARPNGDGAGDARAAIAALWQEKDAGRHARAFLSVRTAFDATLQALDLKSGDEIVMSAVNIESMADIVRAHGVKIVPVDIDLRTLSPSVEAVRAAVTPRTRAILIAHLFGARVALAPYASLRGARTLLVEDCAQAWGGGFRGSPEADLSLFSFGPIKRRTALGGAVAVFRDAELANLAAAIEARYPAMSEQWFLKRLAKYMGLKLASAPLAYGLVLRAIQAATGDAERVIGGVARGFPGGDILKHIRARPPARLLALLHRRIAEGADDSARIAACRELLERLPAEMSVLGADAPSHHFWLTPILVDRPNEAAQALRAHGYDATRGATSLRRLGDNTPNAHRLIEHVLYLPAPWELSADERVAVARLIRHVARPPSVSLSDRVLEAAR